MCCMLQEVHRACYVKFSGATLTVIIGLSNLPTFCMKKRRPPCTFHLKFYSFFERWSNNRYFGRNMQGESCLMQKRAFLWLGWHNAYSFLQIPYLLKVCGLFRNGIHFGWKEVPLWLHSSPEFRICHFSIFWVLVQIVHDFLIERNWNITNITKICHFMTCICLPCHGSENWDKWWHESG